MAFTTLAAGSGVELSYTDSGVPTESRDSYTTIVAIHGMCFTNLIFERMKAVAYEKGIRIIAPNRRSFPGSTELSSEDFNVLMTGGTHEERDTMIQARGHEIATFIDTSIQTLNLCPISDDGQSGGIILLGWSLGAALALAAIAHSTTLPIEARGRLSKYIRSLVLYESAPIVLGLPTPEQNWAPLVDTSIPEALRLPAFGQWCTAYFDHGDLTKRDLNSLSWVLGSKRRVPTIYNIPEAQLKEMECYGPEAISDLPFLFHFAKQLEASYRKAFYDPEILEAFPKMKLTYITGDKTGAFGIAGLWALQDDEKEAGGKRPVDYRIIPGINHFWHWDEPEKALEGFLACA
ncbi:hypothetical protein H0H81_008778 [Sphagnurus paluster]|uniref:AB hydrolase-1 domain-containing protein n=1 Tax=Sphagnurus paluster TaxID=117069 RepID=A0A9P7GJY4_9AGAR|nr:hypothetical protein H0H81_008778 [Sphagnurus paluster]